jgi:tetratricopeptide (TPR) repeat protein
MRIRHYFSFTLVLMSYCVPASAQAPGPQPTFYTMVREDSFAGFMAGDMERFEKAMKYTDEVLAKEPQNPNATVWLGAGMIFRATRLYDKGETAKADELYDQGLALMDKALALDPGNAGVHASYGGVLAFFSPKLPEERRKAALERARARYEFLYKGQETFLDGMPLHFRGEVLAGLAETNQKLGDVEQAQVYLKRIAATMPNTPYARTAERWMAHPDAVPADQKIVCQSCHDAGRLHR